MVDQVTDDRVSFTEYLALTESARTFADVLDNLLHRLRVVENGAAGPLEITLVRRMLPPELDRLQLSPKTAVWLEVRGNARLLTAKRGNSEAQRATSVPIVSTVDPY